MIAFMPIGEYASFENHLKTITSIYSLIDVDKKTEQKLEYIMILKGFLTQHVMFSLDSECPLYSYINKKKSITDLISNKTERDALLIKIIINQYEHCIKLYRKSKGLCTLLLMNFIIDHSLHIINALQTLNKLNNSEIGVILRYFTQRTMYSFYSDGL